MQLLERHRDAEIHDLGNGKRQLTTGGDIYNPLPFDGGPRAPGKFVFADGVQQGNWTWLGKGEQGYLVKPSTGTVRVYPIKGDKTKYIQISGMADNVCEVNQIDDRNLEIFRDGTYTRWSLKMGPQGFKPEILLKPGYSGDSIFQFKFELNGGLELDGAWIIDGATRVLKMHNPFSIDAEGTQRVVSESLVNGVVTLTADLNGFVYPGIVDPALGPINPSKDTFLIEGQSFGYGQETSVSFVADAGSIRRILTQFDISNIPPTALVVSSDFEWYAQGAANYDGRAYTFYRLTRTDWEDAGKTTNGAEANWNNYKDPNVPWTMAGGDYSLTETDGPFTYINADLNTLKSHTVDALTQDAITNRSGLFSFIAIDDNEGVGAGTALVFSSLENTTAARRPKLTVVYTVPSSAPAESDVRVGVVYGDASEFTGTLAVPAVGNVRDGVAVDDTVGTYEPASEADVRKDVQYGAGGTEFTGELVSFSASYDLPQEIILEDEEAIIFEGCD